MKRITILSLWCRIAIVVFITFVLQISIFAAKPEQKPKPDSGIESAAKVETTEKKPLPNQSIPQQSTEKVIKAAKILGLTEQQIEANKISEAAREEDIKFLKKGFENFVMTDAEVIKWKADIDELTNNFISETKTLSSIEIETGKKEDFESGRQGTRATRIAALTKEFEKMGAPQQVDDRFKAFGTLVTAGALSNEQLINTVALLKKDIHDLSIPDEKKQQFIAQINEIDSPAKAQKLYDDMKKQGLFKPTAQMTPGAMVGAFFLLSKLQKVGNFLTLIGFPMPEFPVEVTPNFAVTTPTFASSISGYGEWVGYQINGYYKDNQVKVSVYVANLNTARGDLAEELQKDGIYRLSELEAAKLPTEEVANTLIKKLKFTPQIPPSKLRWGYSIKIDLPPQWNIERDIPFLHKLNDLGIISPKIILSTFSYFDPEFQVSIRPGVTILSKIRMSGPFAKINDFVKKIGPYLSAQAGECILEVSIPNKIKDARIRAILPLHLSVDFLEAYNAGKLSKKPSLIRSIVNDAIYFDIQPSNLAFTAKSGMIIMLMTQAKPIGIMAGVTMKANAFGGIPGVSVEFFGQVNGMIENIFGIDGVSLGNLGFQLDMDTAGALQLAKFGIPSPITGIGMRGQMILDFEKEPVNLSAAAMVTFKENPLPEFVFHASASRISLSPFVKLFARMVKTKAPDNLNIPEVNLRDLQIDFATRSLKIAEKKYDRGFTIKGSLQVNDWVGGGGFVARLEDVDALTKPEEAGKVFTGWGFMSKIDSRFITISGTGPDGIYGTVDDGPYFYFNYAPEIGDKKPTPKQKEANEKAAESSLLAWGKKVGASVGNVAKRYINVINAWKYPTIMASASITIKPWNTTIQTDLTFSNEIIAASAMLTVAKKLHAKIGISIPVWILNVGKFGLHIEFEQDFYAALKNKMVTRFKIAEENARFKVAKHDRKLQEIRTSRDFYQKKLDLDKNEKTKNIRLEIARKKKELADIEKKIKEYQNKCGVGASKELAACFKVPFEWFHAQAKKLSTEISKLEIDVVRLTTSIKKTVGDAFAQVQIKELQFEQRVLDVHAKFMRLLGNIASFEIKKIYVDVTAEGFISAEAGTMPRAFIEYTYKGTTRQKEWKINLQKLIGQQDLEPLDTQALEFSGDILNLEDLDFDVPEPLYG